MRFDAMADWLKPGICLLAAALCCGVAEAQEGGGFFVTRDGYFVTSYRATADATHVAIRDRDGTVHSADVVASDPATDLALLKTEGNFVAIPIARPNTLKPGDRVYAAAMRIGEARDSKVPPVELIESRLTGLQDGANALRISVPADPGAPGGAVLSADGNVVGVLVATMKSKPDGSGTAEEFIAYAIKSEYLLALIDAHDPNWSERLASGARAASLPAGEQIAAAIGAVGRGAADAAASAPAESGENTLRLAAERGDPSAQSELGLMYLEGRGVDSDEVEAANWLRLAAEKGEPSAQNRLGVLIRDGQGVEPDEVEAARWFNKSAEQGNGDAQTNLGLAYYQGRGVPQDESAAVRWFRSGAEQGNALAQHYLAMSYAEGRGVDRDPEQAAKWFAQSSHLRAQAGAK
jgi:TPR repeat protein